MRAVDKLNLRNPWHLIAVGFGSGLAPHAPGTFGSLAALPLCMLLVYLPWPLLLAITLLVFILGIKACNVAEQAMGEHDNGHIVIDEFVGMFISIIAFPPYWYLTPLAFILFRIFDIFKPWPVGLADRKVKGGFGIMLDDVLAGIYALITAHLIFLAF